MSATLSVSPDTSKYSRASGAWPWPRYLAHRGAGLLAPENTLAALRRGLEFGFHAVEFDVMLAADGIPVLMHDVKFGRTVAGLGEVASTPSEQLLNMDAGRWYGPEYAGERVPAYAEVLRFCMDHGIWMNVEIKPAPGYERQTGAVVAGVTDALFIQTSQLAPLFSSFCDEALAAAREVAPRFARGLLVDALPTNWRERAEATACVAVHCNHLHLDAARARAVKQACYGLLCYTVDTVERARELWAWGVDAICTDRPDRFAQGPAISG